MRPDGTLVPIGSTPTGQRGTCWITASGNLLVTSNAGSATVSTLSADAAGVTTHLAETATGAGTVDASFTPDGQYLYVQTGLAGEVDGYTVGSAGTLTANGVVTVPGGAGAEGIVAW